MARRLRRQLVALLPEPTLRRLQRLRHREHPSLNRPVGRAPARGVSPAVVTAFDAHAVRAEIAAAVAAALDFAAVPYVLLPAPRGGVAQVAVSREDRARALTALDSVDHGAGWVLEPGPTARSKAPVVRAYRVLAATGGHVLGGPELACEIAFWTPVTGPDVARPDGDPHTPGTRLAPTPNQIVGYLSEAAWQRATTAANHWIEPDPAPEIFEVTEPIDIVYTWVDGNDPQWQARKAAYEPDTADDHNPSALHGARYLSRDELRYSLRSVAMYAGWVRRIHIVTDGQVPAWLDASHPKIAVVDHKQIFRDPDVLPVFNSHAIESQLHHIPDLAERYLYLNDDFFFGRPVEPELFFHGNGIGKFFLGKDSLDIDPPSARDLPVNSAAKNQRALIERDFGVTVRRKFKHSAYPQLRSVLDEMEQRYPHLFAQVAASRFRHPEDVSIPASWQHYFAYARGRAVPGDIHYRYQDISKPDTARRLDEILRERPQTFCLNDIVSDEDQFAEQHAALRAFFAEYFPLPSPFEKASPDA